jgi:uncharacterized membrane protein
MCHGAEPVWATIVTAPRGILFDDTDHIRRNARLIGRNAAGRVRCRRETSPR